MNRIHRLYLNNDISIIFNPYIKYGVSNSENNNACIFVEFKKYLSKSSVLMNESEFLSYVQFHNTPRATIVKLKLMFNNFFKGNNEV